MFLNCVKVIEDLVFIKPIINELTSQRSIELFEECLESPLSSSTCKQYVYALLQLLVKKQVEPSMKNRFKTVYESEDEDEKANQANTGPPPTENKEQMLAFFNRVIIKCIAKELAIPDEDEKLEDAHHYQFGISNKPFGVLRTQIVELLADLYGSYHKDVTGAFAEGDLYNKLLFFFEYHPYHNVLH